MQDAPEAAEKAGPPSPETPPSFVFMSLVASAVVISDALTKWWAETTLVARPPGERGIVLIDEVLSLQLAYNRGGAFGMLSSSDETWRGPFFLIISCAAVAFIMSLYRRVTKEQWALRWGLPLVLGGALGNLADRVAKGKVVDFVDYQAGWVEVMNELIQKVNEGWHVTDHWPTFNVADMCICAGVALMAIDMFVSSRNAAGTPSTEKAGDGAAAS
jgi:signal peptidase II